MNERATKKIVIDPGHGGIGLAQKNGRMTINASEYKSLRYLIKVSFIMCFLKKERMIYELWHI